MDFFFIFFHAYQFGFFLLISVIIIFQPIGRTGNVQVPNNLLYYPVNAIFYPENVWRYSWTSWTLRCRSFQCFPEYCFVSSKLSNSCYHGGFYSTILLLQATDRILGSIYGENNRYVPNFQFHLLFLGTFKFKNNRRVQNSF